MGEPAGSQVWHHHHSLDTTSLSRLQSKHRLTRRKWSDTFHIQDKCVVSSKAVRREAWLRDDWDDHPLNEILLVFCLTDVAFLSVSSSSGICVCKTGVYGPKCDECHPGFFHFSSTGCRPCQCHNHTSYCQPQSGNHSDHLFKRLFFCCRDSFHFFLPFA